MKNIEILDLSSILGTYAKQLKELKGAKLAFSMLKNIEKLSTEVKLIEQSKKLPDAYLEYDKKRIELCEKFADKEEDGTPKKKQISETKFEYVLSKDNSDFLEAINNLNTEYTSVLEEAQKIDTDYRTLLDTENDIQFSKVDISDLPSDITLELMSVLKPFLKDEE